MSQPPDVALEAVRPAHIKLVKYLTPGEVCRIFNISTGTLRNWSRDFPEKFPSIRTQGNHRRFRADAIAKLMNEKWHGPRSEPTGPR